MMRRFAATSILMATALVAGVTPLGSVPSAGAVTQSAVIVQGGTTPVDSGLYQNVILPLFSAKYPQFNLQYVSVGTGQAITNAEAGQGDVVFTHSPALENTFVTQGYSYEAGGRYVMASDFVTVGPTSDPAGAVAAGNHNAVAAFKAIAAAGAAGTADFVSRGDASGTNKSEQSIWKLTGIPVNSLGEPVNPSNTSQNATWYHKSGLGQAANLQVANECPFSSGKCYSFSDSGTFNYLLGNGSVPALQIVSRFNDGAGAVGGVGLLLNPYHVYAVNPAKIQNAHINLPGALAFLNFMTSAATQAAIAKYPNATSPAFFPDARPIVTITQNIRKHELANNLVTVSGAVKPSYYLDPPISNSPVFLERAHAPGVILSSTKLGPFGGFKFQFKAAVSDTYRVFLPAYPDGLVTPTNTAYRQSVTTTLNKVTVKSVVNITAVDPSKGHVVGIHGTAVPATQRTAARIQVQYRSGSTWKNLGKAIVVTNGSPFWGKVFGLPHGGQWIFRAHYTDPKNVVDSYTRVVFASVP